MMRTYLFNAAPLEHLDTAAVHFHMPSLGITIKVQVLTLVNQMLKLVLCRHPQSLSITHIKQM